MICIFHIFLPIQPEEKNSVVFSSGKEYNKRQYIFCQTNQENEYYYTNEEGERYMSRLNCFIPGKEIEGIEEDFRSAQKIEQYRLGKAAIYIPEGFRWNYIPLQAITKADESFRVISGGHCVPIREKRPELDLVTESGTFQLQLEKEKSMKIVLDAIS
jgi:hypothetical protein